jgi:hypothetical protein
MIFNDTFNEIVKVTIFLTEKKIILSMGQFHQHAYSQLLRVQMLWRSTYISSIILFSTLPEHSTKSHPSGSQCFKYGGPLNIIIDILAAHHNCNLYELIFVNFMPFKAFM